MPEKKPGDFEYGEFWQLVTEEETGTFRRTFKIKNVNDITLLKASAISYEGMNRAIKLINAFAGVPDSKIPNNLLLDTVFNLFVKWLTYQDDSVLMMLIDELKSQLSSADPKPYVSRDNLIETLITVREDIRIKRHLEFQHLIIHINQMLNIKCPACNGSGVYGVKYQCVSCNGTGDRTYIANTHNLEPDEQLT